MIVKMTNAMISMATMVDPTGVPCKIESKIPTVAQQTESTAEQMVTERKLFNTRMADSAGKITNAETNNEPTRFIANTMITAIRMAINKLNRLTFVPTARAKFSSKVTAKIR